MKTLTHDTKQVRYYDAHRPDDVYISFFRGTRAVSLRSSVHGGGASRSNMSLDYRMHKYPASSMGLGQEAARDYRVATLG